MFEFYVERNLEAAEQFNYSGSVMINDSRRVKEIIARKAVVKIVSEKKVDRWHIECFIK